MDLNIIFTSCRAEGLAFLAGLLFTLAFAPFDLAYFSPVALALLFAVFQGSTPLRALLRGYLFGLASFGLGVSWVFVSMHSFGKVSALGAGTMTFFFCAFWALFPAMAGGLAALVPVKHRLVAMPMVWVLVELLRGAWVLDGFPWLQSAYSQLDTPLAGFVPVVGAYGVNFLCAISAAMLVSCGSCLALFGFKNRRDLFLQRRLWLCGALLLGVWGAGGVLRTVEWTHDVGAPFRVSLIQGNIAQDKKWLPDFKFKTVWLYKTLTEQHWDSKLIIWPETSIPAYLSEVNAPFLQPLSYAARLHGTDMIVALPAKNEAETEKYNALMSLGSAVAMYKKIHLLPFGEIVPWQPWSAWVLDLLGMRFIDFTPGSLDQPQLQAAGYTFNTSICYEDVFGALAIKNLETAAFLVNATNDGWFGDSIEPHQHLQMARMRALETGRFLLRATNTGVTAIVGPNGQVIKQLPLFEVGVLTDAVTPKGGMTPYAYLGDAGVVGLMIFLTAVFVFVSVLCRRMRGAPT